MGFGTLASLLGAIAGEPLEDEHYQANGDSTQRTSTGLMVWRKADNWTAFTDGYRTWVNGPYGLQQRLNTERFSWEKDPIVQTAPPVVKLLTHWLSPMQDDAPQTVSDACARAKRQTPTSFHPALLVPTVYGPWYQSECRTALGSELLPADGPGVSRIMAAIAAQGVSAGGWAIPRFLTEDEGKQQGAAAANCELFVLDIEPYAGFLSDPSADPANYMRGFDSACPRRPWISLVPQATGIDALGHVSAWINWGAGIRPQCYWTDGPALAWPDPASIYLAGVLAKAGADRPVVPIFPRRALDPTGVDKALTAADGNRDIWVLGA